MKPFAEFLDASREGQWRLGLSIAAGCVLVASGWRAIARPLDGDFDIHWEFGRRLLAGESLYAGGLDVPYPPFWAVAHAPASLLPMPVAKALLLPLGIAALFVLLRTLRMLALPAFALEPGRMFWVAAVALLLAGRYVVRDMAEIGVDTAIVAMTWLAIRVAWIRRDGPVGGRARPRGRAEHGAPPG